MEGRKNMQLGNYEYQTVTYKKLNGMYQGMVLIIAQAGKKLTPIIEIPTPASFKTENAAKIEAAALACHLIETGNMDVLIQQQEYARSWPVE